MAANFTFLSPGGLTGEALSSIVEDNFDMEPEPRQRSTLALFDTFDWRLYRSGYWLTRTNNVLELHSRDDDEILEHLRVETQPVFAWDLPGSPLQERISGILDVRALIPLVEVRVEARTYRILDTERKTVARLTMRNLRLGSGRSKQNRIAVAHIRPVRGYFRQAQKLARLLAEAGQPRGRYHEVYLSLLAAAGHTPGDYNPKPQYTLDPQMPSAEAARIIHRHLLDVILANEAGIIADIDTEFLHDYRVSIRRTRSALSQIKGVFPTRDVVRFKADFKYLGMLTNPLRDLDVYLLKEQAYRGMLPAELQHDIDPLFDYLKRKRVQAHRAVVRGFGTKKYARIFDKWGEFLGPAKTEPDAEGADEEEKEANLVSDPDTPNAGRPAIKLAKSRIRKHYQLVVHTGEEILTTGQDEALHALRIECKKLRYLMEFFQSLFPSEQIDFLIQQLKRLQDNLGEFNDLTVQQEYLLRISEELPQGRASSVRTLLAVGALVGELEARQRGVKEAFAGTFAVFTAPDNQDLFEQLFGKQPGGES